MFSDYRTKLYLLIYSSISGMHIASEQLELLTPFKRI